MTDTINNTIESPTTDSEDATKDQTATTEPKPRGMKSTNYGVTRTCLPTILVMHNQGKSTREIAEALGVDHSNIVRRLHEVHRGQDYQRGRADYLAALQAGILENITPEDITKASLRDKTIAAGVLYDKERLERGLSASAIPTSITINIVQASAEPVTIDITDDSRQVPKQVSD